MWRIRHIYVPSFNSVQHVIDVVLNMKQQKMKMNNLCVRIKITIFSKRTSSLTGDVKFGRLIKITNWSYSSIVTKTTGNQSLAFFATALCTGVALKMSNIQRDKQRTV